MTLYIDASAFLKRYLQERESATTESLMLADPEWVTARHTAIEVRRTLARDLAGEQLDVAGNHFRRDWARTTIVELTEVVCEVAAEIAETTLVRTLDALHLGAAKEAGAGQLTLLTYDRRQAEAARGLGWTVLGI